MTAAVQQAAPAPGATDQDFDSDARLGTAFDAGEQAGAPKPASTTQTPPPAGPPAKPDASSPAKTPEQTAPASATAGQTPTTQQGQVEQSQQLAQREQALTQREQAVQQVLEHPQFQQALAAIQQQGQAQPGAQQAGQQQAQQQTPPGKPWANFQPETENEKLLVGYLDGMAAQQEQLLSQVGQSMQQMQGRIQTYDQFVTRQNAERAERDIEGVVKQLGDQFPDLVADPKKLDSVYEEAALLTQAANQAGRTLGAQDAMTKAARMLGYDGLEQRVRTKMQAEVAKASAARTELPTATQAPGETAGNLETALEAAYDRAGG